MKKITSYLKSVDKNFLIIFGLSLIILWPLVSCYYMRGHDSFYHYSNIFALNSNIDFSSFKIFPDKILPIIAYNFGWGEGIFYPSFPHYLAVYIYKVINAVGVTNIFTTMKICHFIILFLSGLFMYFLTCKIFNNKTAGLIAAIIYMTFPYHYIDIFVRDAFSECFMFVFVPIVFLGLEYLFENSYKKFYIFFVIGYVGAIFSHLVLSIYLTLFVLIYLFLNYKKLFKKNIIKSLIFSGIFIILMILPFIGPLFEHTVFEHYTVYIDGLMYTSKLIKMSAVSLMDYFSFERPLAWTGELVFTISFPALILLLVSLSKCFKFKKLDKVGKYFICLLFTIVFMSPFFPWTKLPSFFCNIQFLWRLNLFLAFFISICASSAVLFFNKKTNVFIIFAMFISSIIMMWSFKPMVILDMFDPSKIDINKHGAASFQYIPAKSYEHLDYVKSRNENVIVSDREADISNMISKTPYMSFRIKTKGCTLELPRYYFMGYKITLNGKTIKYGKNENGFIEVKIKKSGNVVVNYSGGSIYYISVFLSLFAIIIFICYVLKIGGDRDEKDKL